jgi:hypothetical protein
MLHIGRPGGPHRLISRWSAIARTVIVLSFLVAIIVVSPTRPVEAQSQTLTGEVLSGGGPLASFAVTLFSTHPSGGPAAALGTAITAADGGFGLSYTPPTTPGAVLYVTASPSEPSPPGDAVVLASVLGGIPIATQVVVNERTTVATGFAMAQFTDGGDLRGTSPGLQNAAAMAQNLVDVTTGQMSAVLTTPPNGVDAQRPFNSMANMVAACVVDALVCSSLLDAASAPAGPPATDTFQAVIDIARNPWHSVAELFAISLIDLTPPYTPRLLMPPDAWTLAISFWGDGRSINGPGNFAIDHEGNVWVTVNYAWDPDILNDVCGSNLLVKFTPSGRYAPGSPYVGGGLSGAGFGIDIDPYGDVWVGNFGFAAPDCPDQPPHNSVSQFRGDGTPVSPGTGFTQGGISFPQGTVSDSRGNIWVANCGNDTVTIFPDGNPNQAVQITRGALGGIIHPFDIAHNNADQAFVTGVMSDSVAILEPDGSPAPRSPVVGGGLNRPLGIAADSQGNMWVANSALIDLPCPGYTRGDIATGSVTLINADGTLARESPFTGGGLTVPWGITTDGNDNVWVANFAGKRVSQFCGLAVKACRPGAQAGDAISPDHTGYGSAQLVRNTGVAVDQAGNVWLANNWKDVPLQSNPGGYEVVVLVGLAGPVSRPAPQSRPEPPEPSPLPVPATTALAAVPRFTG